MDSIENQIMAMVQPVLEATLEKSINILEEEIAELKAALAHHP